MRFFFWLAAVPTFCQCADVAVAPTADYRYLVASGASGPYRWLRNGAEFRAGVATQTFLLYGDEVTAAELDPGRFGQAFRGVMTFPVPGAFDTSEGSIQLYAALQADGAAATEVTLEPLDGIVLRRFPDAPRERSCAPSPGRMDHTAAGPS